MIKIGYSPSKNFPYVPRQIANLETGELLTLGEKPQQLLATEAFEMTERGELCVGKVDCWKRNHWLILDDEPEWIPFGSLSAWKEKRAEELVQEAGSLRGNPLRVLSLAKAAATLRSFSLPDLLTDLHSRRKSDDEGPVQIFSRVRDSQEEGRKSE